MFRYWWIAILVFFLALGAASAEPIKVAVVDTGIDEPKTYMCKTGHLDLTGEGLKDRNGHGTEIASIIAEGIRLDVEWCMLVIKYHAPNVPGPLTVERVYQALTHAIKQEADVINLSGGGPKPDPAERRSIAKAKLIVQAAGNEKRDLSKNCNYFPACYGIGIIVGSNDWPNGNYGGPVNAKASGYYKGGAGTSYSAARITAREVNRLWQERSRGKE